MKKVIKGILWWIRTWRQSKKSVGKKCAYRRKYMKFAKMARKKGVVQFRIDRIAKEYSLDYFEGGGKESPEKWYLYDYGIATSKSKWYGLTKENYKCFLSDYDFYNTDNYMNEQFVYWFDDKLSTYYLLQPFSKYLPKHYFYAKNGVMYPLNIEEKHNYHASDVVSLVKTRAIAAKKCIGGHGDGFYKFEYLEDVFYINDKKYMEKDFERLLEKLDGYIITDFVKPAHYLREIGGEDAFAVLRAMVIYDDVKGPQFERLMLRMGTKKSGHTQALHDYLYIGIDENGAFFNPLIELSDYDFETIENHPDTGKKLLGNSLKNLELLKKTIREISGYLPITPYLILDIIPTDDSFIILEINSHGQPFNFEPFHPVKESENFRKLFNLSN